jgi:hypothetical protein
MLSSRLLALSLTTTGDPPHGEGSSANMLQEYVATEPCAFRWAAEYEFTILPHNTRAIVRRERGATVEDLVDKTQSRMNVSPRCSSTQRCNRAGSGIASIVEYLGYHRPFAAHGDGHSGLERDAGHRLEVMILRVGSAVLPFMSVSSIANFGCSADFGA